MISPGVPADLDVLAPVRARGVPVIGELELAAPFLKGRNIGITGTNGKTTTTALTGHILRESGIACQVGGNIGTAPAEMVETSRPDQWNVLELSSFQLETIETFHAPIAACLNVTQNHLDRHHTFENYVNAKARLFETQGSGRSRGAERRRSGDRDALPSAPRPKTVWFSGTRQVSGAWLDGDVIRMGDGELLNVNEPAPARPSQLRKRNGGGADGAIERARAWHRSRAPLPPSRRWSIASNLFGTSTAWLITTIPKPPAWTRRSKRSTRSPAAFGSSWAAKTKTATTPFCASPCGRKLAPRC